MSDITFLLEHPVIGISPLEHPDSALVVAVARGGALGVLDLGRGDPDWRTEISRVARKVPRGFGVRVPQGVKVGPKDLPGTARVIILPAAPDMDLSMWERREVLVQVTSLAEALAAQAAGAAGLIAKGSESGGAIGNESAFMLLQHIVDRIDLPVWVQGGIGFHTAAACLAGGARGVVLDSQLALTRESSLPQEVKAAISSMDGSETVVVAGHRLFTRPDLPVARMSASDTVDEVRSRLGGSDLHHDLLPIGQDGALAKSLADRCLTAGSLVQAVRKSMVSYVRDARVLRPFDAGSSLAKAHGLRVPIVQGPMTRVSDCAGFAEAVAKAGGLPFLALSLMRGDAVRKLLQETARRLGDLPWGVGVLGFVPEALREEQLAAVREVCPPVALIAGGRPSQARPLEKQGTATYLHVPSPGLLDMFLKDGARKFVFEGRECGGHVGPRSSFVLWETQIERLMAFDKPEELHLLFAGGIHDARSSAMVAAMVAPLCAKGARVGVLMGTAYLFTKEAVSTGAILPGFQESAIGCKTTSLLETAPGHATRCVETDFVRAFRSERERLEAEGKTSKEVWAALEELNLGRLRIASKGVRRDGDRLVDVNESDQKSQGMYMIGQVAVLRDEVLSIDDLHWQVAEGSCIHLARVELPEQPKSSMPPADVAIVGMSCFFPGADGMAAFWANILSGKNSITEVDPKRWNPDIYYDPEATGATAGEKTPSKWGGFLPEITFDPLEFGIPPKSLASIEPVQLLALKAARMAMLDAGYDDREFDRERASVIFGAEAGTDLSGGYGFRAMYPQYVGEIPEALDKALPSLTEDSFPGVLANVIAGRIANRLDMGGVNYTVDAACASSLAAVDLAIKELTAGTSDLVLCGGADLHNTINDYLLFASTYALSPTGQCRTFDAKADGIALGEGVACLVLKRLADAEADGDRVYAVIKGVAGSSDGRYLGLTAPRKEGQMRALDRAYERAGVSPAQIGLLEAHGTGTVVGDRTELNTLTEVFTAAGAEVGACALGSVKSQIGHTKCAAGMAGIIKAALALHHGVRPPTLSIEQPNPAYDQATSPFTFYDTARPWPAARRFAGVSAFGFGGANFHAVLSAYEPADAMATSIDEWPAELFLFRGDRAAVTEQVARLERWLDADADLRLRDLAKGTIKHAEGPLLAALVVSSLDELRERLDDVRSFKGDNKTLFFLDETVASDGKLAFLFPGQGSQRPGMLGELFVTFPRLQRFLTLAGEYAVRMFPPAAFSREEKAQQQKALTDTRTAQPALGAADLAMAELLKSAGVVPDLVGGHSYGELVALCVAGAFPERVLIHLSEARAWCILEAAGDDPGTMAAVMASAERVREALPKDTSVVIGNLNAPEQTVISGPTEEVKRVVELLKEKGLSARAIPVACAFHSPVVDKASPRFAEHIAEVEFSSPTIPVWSNTTAEPYPSDGNEVRDLLTQQLGKPVLFQQQIESMYAAGARTFVEVGPGHVLSGLVRKILGDRPHTTVTCEESGKPGVKQFLIALAKLAGQGVNVQAEQLFEGRDAVALNLAGKPTTRPVTAWRVTGHLARPVNGELPSVAMQPVTNPVPGAAAAAASHGAGGDREATIVEYLRGVRELVGAQREVMLRYLGAAPSEIQALPNPAAVLELAASQATPAVAATPEANGAVSVPAASASVSEVLLGIVSERTGYPPEMLDLDLDLEAELSIDSIKRIEILGELRDRVGLGGDGDDDEQAIEDLAKVKSLRGILDWLEERVPAGSNGASAASTAQSAPTPPLDIKATLLSIVSERTGYPAEMLDLDLDLEAELSIDSIKRIEILGELRDRVGLSSNGDQDDEAVIEELAKVKALRGILDWFEEHANVASSDNTKQTTAGANGAAPSTNGVTAASIVADEPATISLSRHRFKVVTAADVTIDTSTLAGKRIAIVDDGRGVATALSQALAAYDDVSVQITRGDEPMGEVDVWVYLAGIAVDAPADVAKNLFASVKEAVQGGATSVVAATGLGGRFGQGCELAPVAGISGVLKTVAREFPNVQVRVVDVDPSAQPATLAQILEHELCAADEILEVGHVGDTRYARELVATPIEQGANGGDLALDENSVVLITGGARGITARVAVELAQRYRCRLQLVGRSPVPEGDEDAAFADAHDSLALRKVLVGQGLREPAKIEAQCARILAARQMRSTFAAIADAGASVDYHAVDVRDREAFAVLVDAIYRDHGRIDGVVHGAGVLEDKLIRDKTPESFARVFDTKVNGALTLADKLREDTKFVVFFSSIAGAFGNRGQVDYSAANDVLDKTAAWLGGRIAGRAVSINWGPWAGTGMVSDELAREYARRGMGLIPPGEGVAALLDELRYGSKTDAQVVLMCADPKPLLVTPRARLTYAEVAGEGDADRALDG